MCVFFKYVESPKFLTLFNVTVYFVCSSVNSLMSSFSYLVAITSGETQETPTHLSEGEEGSHRRS